MLDSWYGALAVELKEGASAPTLLERSAANTLAHALGSELARHLQGLQGLGVCWMAGCYDVAQLLRPGFPVHAELHRLYQAGVVDPLQQPQLMTMTARLGVAPSPQLQPQESLQGGSLLYLPVLLLGSEQQLQPARERLEACLLEEGLLDARSARTLIDALQVPIEHARLLSCDDLCAITAANLQHAGLDSVWQVLETVLFRPQVNADLPAEHGLRWSVIGAVAHLHLSLSDQPAAADMPPRMLWVRQALALLDAHAVAWRILPSAASGPVLIEQDEAGFWIEWKDPPAPLAAWKPLCDEQGALLWLELLDAHGRQCGSAVPLHAAGHAALRQHLQQLQLSVVPPAGSA